MDFFQAQDRARQKSSLLVFYFIAAVVGIITVLYTVAIFANGYARTRQGYAESSLWQPEIFALVTAGTLVVIGCGSLFKTLALRSGGGSVALSLGGEKIDTNTTDAAERRVLNVVEEMAIASGVRVPEVYILPEEGINAFAAGWSPDDAAVSVTRGAVNTLTRDELQGVIAHEFSHILNGDMRLNIRLIGLLFGILLLTIVGRVIVRTSGGRRSSKDDKGGGAIIVIGLALIIVGYIGVFFGHLIQAAVSRQREFLADASAVQFTRNPSGISGALKKIGGFAFGSRVRDAHATESCHMFFASAFGSSLSGAFATHPPLEDRIRAIDPMFDGKFPTVTAATEPSRASTPPPIPRRSIAPIQLAGLVAALSGDQTVSTGHASVLIESIPIGLRAAARDPSRCRAVVLALLVDMEDPLGGRKQGEVLQSTLSPADVEVIADITPSIGSLSCEARLALLDLTLPALRQFPPDQFSSFVDSVNAMILADTRVTPFEFALRHIVNRARGVAMQTGDRPGTGPVLRPSTEDLVGLLTVMARAGSDDQVEVTSAFRAGAEKLGLTQDLAQADSNTPRSLNQLAAALGRLERTSAEQRRAILIALAATASADGVLQPDEHALLRAFAAALNVPAPLLA